MRSNIEHILQRVRTTSVDTSVATKTPEVLGHEWQHPLRQSIPAHYIDTTLCGDARDFANCSILVKTVTGLSKTNQMEIAQRTSSGTESPRKSSVRGNLITRAVVMHR